jgi:hypothetical protein
MSRRHLHRNDRRHGHGGKRNDPDLLVDVRSKLRRDHPLDLLAMASGHIEVATERPLSRFGGRTPVIGLEELVDSFIGTDRPETTALLTAMASMVDEQRLVAKIRRELARRPHPLPDWLRDLDRVTVRSVRLISEPLGDAEDVLIELAWPGTHRLTLFAYIEHNLGSVLEDLVAAPAPLDEVVEMVHNRMVSPPAVEPIDPADARARVLEAIESGERMLPPVETATWPVGRPLLEWACRLLPPGGTGYVRPEWSDEQQQELADRFFASEAGLALGDTADHRGLVDNLLWFGCAYGPCDPLHASPRSVAILLQDWFPRKIAAGQRYLRRFPAVLAAWVRFAHAERGIPEHLTEMTLHTIDECRRDYLAAIANRQRPMGAVALAEAMRHYAGLPEPPPPPSWEESMLESLARRVGSAKALATLDDRPLPDEAFDWSRVPDDIQPSLREVLALTDRYCEEALDHEYRTIVRRLVARAVERDPGVFRKGRTPTTAAGLVWVAGHGSELFREITVTSMAAWFGVTSSATSTRGQALRKAAGVRNEMPWQPELGDPTLLHSKMRRSLITRRDRYQARLAGG